LFFRPSFVVLRVTSHIGLCPISRIRGIGGGRRSDRDG
jgi:hypothetical protein